MSAVVSIMAAKCKAGGALAVGRGLGQQGSSVKLVETGQDDCKQQLQQERLQDEVDPRDRQRFVTS